MPSDFTSFTYHTRLHINPDTAEILQDCATLLSGIERHLFAAISSGKKAANLKADYIKEYKITARHFNAIRVQLEGKISSISEIQKNQIVATKQKIASIKKRVQKLEKTSSKECHQKKRHLDRLKCKLKQLQSNQETGKVSLCFGSKKLFRAQFNLTENGYASHEEWFAEWQHSREDSFFLLGSKDETSGNQTCTATLAEDNTLTLRIRLPDGLGHGKYLTLNGIHFEYGQNHILEALKSYEERIRLQKLNDSNAAFYGLPISYRFKRDEKGWRVFVSLPVAKTPLKTTSKKGVIGIDINGNHLALAETDRFGNPVAKKSISLNTYGKNKNQTKALIGETCKQLIDYAKQTGKTLIIENLDFQKKKAELQQTRPSHARMLSGLAYSHIKSSLKSRAWREGVEIIEVNPAYTSLIGRVKFSKRYGLSIHQSAALVIGRRYLKASERVPRHLEEIPDGKEGRVALSLPVRNRDKHVWSIWGVLNRKLKTVLAAHFRAIKNRSSSSKSAPEINIPDLVGEIPTREFVSTTARLTCLNASTE